MSTFWATIAVLLFVSILTGGGVYLYTRQQRTTLPQPQEELSIPMIKAVILTKLKDVKELATVRSEFQSKATFSDSKKLMGHDVPGTARKFTLSYTGTIVCGCDLDEIRFADSFFDRNHLKITLPYSRVFDIYPDISSFDQHENSSGIFADNITIEEQNRAIAADIETVKQRLIDEGILLKSNENMQSLIKSITEPLGVTAEIAFANSNELEGQPDLLRLNS